MLLQAVERGLRRIYRPGVMFAKAGVCLLDIRPATAATWQGELFSTMHQDAYPEKGARLMAAMDTLNARFGRETVVPAAALSEPDAVWAMRQERKTPAYTTDWKHIVEIWR